MGPRLSVHIVNTQPTRTCGLGSLTVTLTLPDFEYINKHMNRSVVHMQNSPWSHGPKIGCAISKDPVLQ